MEGYKLFLEGMRSNFYDYQACVGFNFSNDENQGLCFAEKHKILDYYYEHGFLISKVCTGNEYKDIAAIKGTSKEGEHESHCIYIEEPEILYDKNVMTYFIDEIENSISKTNFVKDVALHGDQPIDCGFNEIGKPNVKSYNMKDSLDYLLIDRQWANDIDFEEVCSSLAEVGNIKAIEYFNNFVRNIDYTNSYSEALKQNDDETLAFIREKTKIYDVFATKKLLDDTNQTYDKSRINDDILLHPLKTIYGHFKHSQIEKNRERWRRVDYEYDTERYRP